MRFALVKNNKVENIVIGFEGYSNPDYDHTVNVDGMFVDLGWDYSNGSFSEPSVEQPDPRILAKERVIKAMEFGKDLMADYAAYNAVSGLNSAQIIGIAQLLAPVQSLLLAGSIETAKAILQSLSPDESLGLTQSVKDAFLNKMQEFLDANP